MPCGGSVWVYCVLHLWGPWHSGVGRAVLCMQSETCTVPQGGSSLSWAGGKVGRITLFSHFVCSYTSPQHCRPRPPRLCPAVRHRLISPGARSRCADALVPASNSQLLALTATFLEQRRRGRSSQDCLM